MKKILLLLMGVLTTCTWSFAQDNENLAKNLDCNFVYQDIGYHITDSVNHIVEVTNIYEPAIFSAPQGIIARSPLTRKVSFQNEDSGKQEVVIPEYVEYKGIKYLVSGITEYGFTSPSYDNIGVVTFPATIKKIGFMAFDSNQKIRKIIFTGKNPIKIDGRMIARSSVQELVLSDGIDELKGGEFGFNGCLKRIKLGAGLKKVGGYLFYGLAMLKTIELSPENHYLTLFQGSLYNRDKTKLLAVPELDTPILSIPAGTTEIDSFACATRLISKIECPSSLRKIGNNAFAENRCAEINLPEGLEEIGSNAFYFASRLEKLTIPSTVKLIGEGAFYNCQALKTVRCHRIVPLAIHENTFWNTDFENCVLYVPVGCVVAYRNAEVWKQFKHIEEDASGIGGIDAGAVQSVKYVNMAGMESDKQTFCRAEHCGCHSCRRLAPRRQTAVLTPIGR